jgi:heme-degrading monooxygenase HmoA
LSIRAKVTLISALTLERVPSTRRTRKFRPGAGTLRLVRDIRNAGRFFSVGQWDDAEAIRVWKSSAEFKERLGRVVRQATEFEPTEQVTLVKVTGGTVEAVSPPAELEAIHAPT